MRMLRSTTTASIWSTNTKAANKIPISSATRSLNVSVVFDFDKEGKKQNKLNKINSKNWRIKTTTNKTFQLIIKM